MGAELVVKHGRRKTLHVNCTNTVFSTNTRWTGKAHAAPVKLNLKKMAEND